MLPNKLPLRAQMGGKPNASWPKKETNIEASRDEEGCKAKFWVRTAISLIDDILKAPHAQNLMPWVWTKLDKCLAHQRGLQILCLGCCTCLKKGHCAELHHDRKGLTCV